MPVRGPVVDGPLSWSPPEGVLVTASNLGTCHSRDARTAYYCGRVVRMNRRVGESWNSPMMRVRPVCDQELGKLEISGQG